MLRCPALSLGLVSFLQRHQPSVRSPDVTIVRRFLAPGQGNGPSNRHKPVELRCGLRKMPRLNPFAGSRRTRESLFSVRQAML